MCDVIPLGNEPSKEESKMLFGIVRLLEFAQLDAEELGALDLADAIERAVDAGKRTLHPLNKEPCT